MTSENTEQASIRLDFKYLTPLVFDKLIEEWKGDYPTDRSWWKSFNTFSKYFLEYMCYNKIEVTEENYEEFVPTMEDYFLTDKEYKILVGNVAFMKEDTPSAYLETPIYKIYNFMKLWDVKPTFTELAQMTYKRFMKLYLYTLGDKFIIPSANRKGDIYQ
jgi:hypothetical protein